MRTYPELIAFICLAVLVPPVAASSRMGPVEVSLRDGRPCFSMTAKDWKRDPKQRFQALVVSDASEKPVTSVWEFQSVSPDGIPITAGTCFGYGQTAPGTTSTDPAALKAGRVYSVSMNVSQSDSSDPTMGYVGTFCMAEEGAERRLVPVTPDQPAWHSGSCK
ncbi:hypothetical protein [Roseateles amylovorans]|uniref:Secreted protein n=1 Tax=Roseateles amylovorans TaxID=2978473 RepID=A0ABY6B4J1_9BURK|nr:hypothetical protein [Roseateles amylovorans]UXH80110.1 hypothetical protein N4261_09595 [Roseateles amylovorans]